MIAIITELYAWDSQLVDSFDTIVSIGIQERSGTFWRNPVPLGDQYIISESLEIKQSICDDKELRIGGCIPSQLTLDIMNLSEDLSGRRIVVKAKGRHLYERYPSTSLYPSEELYPNTRLTGEYILFIGQIYSCKKTNNHQIRKLIAFDRMYYPSTAWCKGRIWQLMEQNPTRSFTFSEIWNTFCPSALMPEMSSDLINYATELEINPDIWKDVIDKRFTFLDFYAMMCELNGVFLIEDTPSGVNVDTAQPRIIKPYVNVGTDGQIGYYTISSYSQLTYEEFLQKEIRYARFDISGSGRFVYLHQDPYEGYSHYMSDNLITQSISDGENVKKIVNNLGSTRSSDRRDKITGKVYEFRPFKASIFNRWWVQVGDRVKLPTNDPDVPYVESIVLSRTLRGMYGMTVEIEAKGVEIMGKETDEEIG